MDPMEAIKLTFFQECDELLSDLEAGLLALEAGEGDAETVNAVFRAVHSVKGGAGAFGLDTLVRFAHVFETTLDAVRTGQLAPDPHVIRVMLRCADRLADHLADAKAGVDRDLNDAELIAELQGLAGGDPNSDVVDEEPDFGFKPVSLAIGPDALDPSATTPEGWLIRFKPHADLYRSANDPLLLFRELERLGVLEVALDCSEAPALDALVAEEACLVWTLTLTSAATEAQVLDVFEFVEGDCDLTVTRLGAPAPAEAPLTLDGYDPQSHDPATPMPDLDEILRMARTTEAAPAQTAPAVVETSTGEPARSTGGENALVQTTIRVDLERVDRLIDLVGELVINQAMLAQQVHEAGIARSGPIAVGLDDLEQLTREIQDSVMAIRAQPVKSVFQRMPRLVRELADMTGKSARLVTEGEATEVDKTVIERLTDPLTHMIRNAVDHGLETPADRIAAGKPGEGTIRLSAQHRSGRIVIEVSDDGKGIDRPRVRAIAVEKGIVEPDALLTDDEIDNLIFAPGFSTAAVVSDISGRGVGMDVVKRSIQALGGRISIASTPGQGSVFTLSLPLTLAVLDGMVVSVGDQTLVVPITVIVETLQPKAADIRALGPQGSVLSVRGAHVPLIDVSTSLGFPSDPDAGAGVTLLIESELGGLAALRVDAIQGQRQVVIKSLEQNYNPVPGIAAATILGDGRVALILDVDAVISRRRLSLNRPIPLAQAS